MLLLLKSILLLLFLSLNFLCFDFDEPFFRWCSSLCLFLWYFRSFNGFKMLFCWQFLTRSIYIVSSLLLVVLAFGVTFTLWYFIFYSLTLINRFGRAIWLCIVMRSDLPVKHSTILYDKHTHKKTPTIMVWFAFITVNQHVFWCGKYENEVWKWYEFWCAV